MTLLVLPRSVRTRGWRSRGPARPPTRTRSHGPSLAGLRRRPHVQAEAGRSRDVLP
jgi:hypothetical protein